MNSRINPLGWPTWAWRCLLGLMVVFALLSVIGGAGNLARSAGLLHDIGPFGATLTQRAGTPPGWFEVTKIWPVGPAGEAGIEKGDLVRFDRAFGYEMRPHAGWPNPVTIERDGRRFHRTIEVTGYPHDTGTRALLALYALQALANAAFGMLLLIRGRRNRAATMLGVLLLGFGAVSGSAPIWMPSATFAQAMFISMMPSLPVISYLWPTFSLEMSGGAVDRRQARRVQAVALASAALGALIILGKMFSVTVPLVGLPGFQIAFIAANQIFGYATIARNYGRNDAAGRNRIKIVVIAFLCFLISTVLAQALDSQLEDGYAPSDLVGLRLALTAIALAGIALLVYGVLRQKLFDFGFALNRTLVYGAVSFILLAAFGLAEWAVEHVVPEAWHANGPLVSAMIALALFLSFHRLRDWVERHIERVFFGAWHRNEATLKRFITAADHFGSAPALLKAFAAELSRFAEGAEAALYIRAGDGYELRAGKLSRTGRRFADGDRALALMRAERQPVELARAHSALPGKLALPLLDQGALLGFALLADKPDGGDYRPDEVALLGWAAQQVGFAAQAQHVRELENTIGELRAELAARGRRPKLTAA